MNRVTISRGTSLKQTTSFQSRYNMIGAGKNGNNFELSMDIGTLDAAVTYTVYPP